MVWEFGLLKIEILITFPKATLATPPISLQHCKLEGLQSPPQCSFEHFLSPSGTNGWKVSQVNRFFHHATDVSKTVARLLLPPHQLNEVLFQRCCTDNIPDSANELLLTRVSLQEDSCTRTATMLFFGPIYSHQT